MNIVGFWGKINEAGFELHLGRFHDIWLEDTRKGIKVGCFDWTEDLKKYTVNYEAYLADACSDTIVEMMKLMEETIEFLEKEEEKD